MKKMSLLMIILLAGLPGCGCRKQQEADRSRREPVEQYMDIVDENEIVDLDGDDMDELTAEDMESFNFDDEDSDMDWKKKLGLDEDDLAGIEDELDELNLDENEFAWIDAQADDEFKKLYFSFNHYGIRADQKEALNYDIEQVKQLMAETGSIRPTVVVEGHACQEGTPAYNLALSEKRAKAVADLFVAAGVDRSTIKVVGRGQECPTSINGKVINGSREERAPNRRVEVRVIYT